MTGQTAVPGCNRIGHACQTILACAPYEAMYGKHERPSPAVVAAVLPLPREVAAAR